MSDTLVIGIGNTDKDLEKLILFSKDLLEKGIKKNLPIRGAISLGDYIFEDIVYGQAVITAYDLEKQQNWIGISLATDIVVHNHIKNLVALYPLPLNKGDIQIYNTVIWEVPNYENLVKNTVSPIPGDSLHWDWHYKILNTALFSIYLQFFKKLEINQGSFHISILPMIEKSLEKLRNMQGNN